MTKSLDTFDFTAISGLNKSLVLELMRCEWIDKRENIIALGLSGVGKTHTALVLGLTACQKGISVIFTTAAALVHELMDAHDEKRLRTLQKHLANVRLLIIDELGYVPLSPSVQNSCSKSSAAATSMAPPWSHRICRATNGPAYWDPSN